MQRPDPIHLNLCQTGNTIQSHTRNGHNSGQNLDAHATMILNIQRWGKNGESWEKLALLSWMTTSGALNRLGLGYRDSPICARFSGKHRHPLQHCSIVLMGKKRNSLKCSFLTRHSTLQAHQKSAIKYGQRQMP
ncbi:hypothetical protein BPSOL_0639 [Bifidobacterium pseudolongum]|nr:hypothetical protein BPSOL_0639 [Bifidobacterium pseudolongum]